MRLYAILQRSTATGCIRCRITQAEAKRGTASGKYRKQIVRDASGRVKGSYYTQDYVAPSTSQDSASTITLSDIRANAGEYDSYERKMAAKRKIEMWQELTIQFRPVVQL